MSTTVTTTPEVAVPAAIDFSDPKVQAALQTLVAATLAQSTEPESDDPSKIVEVTKTVVKAPYVGVKTAAVVTTAVVKGKIRSMRALSAGKESVREGLRKSGEAILRAREAAEKAEQERQEQIKAAKQALEDAASATV